jgi:transposase
LLDQEIRQASGSPGVAANLPRVERILPCALDQRVCKRCGKETVVIGYEESSQLDVEPARYFVLVTKREKRACRSCEHRGVVSAPLPPRIIEKCLKSDRIIETVVGKYCNHTPLPPSPEYPPRSCPRFSGFSPVFPGNVCPRSFPNSDHPSRNRI